ncbi:MAG: hypothetical protein Q8O83_00630 [bacterium]|nr:hypothetical protein [bacterium]
MNIFKSKSMNWWQVGVLKLALLSIGIAIGAQWSIVFSKYTGAFFVVGIALGVYSALVWFRKK